ncbi:peptidyl-alpha-hydroxyglycine alpha-amidating lyase family protein [Schlesneria sp.]|uniref:peptidyl-alpha-hydroxyglycine alpha-amidating lyase family protein n=1 Tax=Schlesneria sp. TaxID=2762018 RepID=UPI002F0E6ED5
MTPSESKIITSGGFTYRAIADWAKWPVDWHVWEVTGVATDSKDRVFVFNRSDHPVAVFDPDGNLLFSWGEGLFNRPHGIWIGPDDSVYCTDDLDHTIHKFTAEGRHVLTLGTSGKPSDTGATSIDYRTIRYAGPPFHFPTNLAVAPNGDWYVADGYGNARIHKFSPDGTLQFSWGEPGSGPGQFHVPHGITVDRNGVVYVADRENSRLQLFSPEGKFLSEWTDIARPCEMVIDQEGLVYVAELGYRAGMWPGTTAPAADSPGGRLSIFDSSGHLLSRFGGGERPQEAGDFFAPHDLWLDKNGSLYIAEVVWSANGRQYPSTGRYHTLQKFERLAGVTP